MASYGYVRVSTLLQAEEGHSLQVQQRQVESYAVLKDLELTRLFVERGVSGSMPMYLRPEGSLLWAELKRGDHIITPKLDRMFRSSLDALSMMNRAKKLGVQLHMIDLGGNVTGEGIGKLVFAVLAAVAEAERDRIRERIKDVKADQRRQGRYLGGSIPFGFDLAHDGILTPNSLQQHDLALAYRLWRVGNSFRTLMQFLAARGHIVSHATIRKHLLRMKKTS